MQCMDMQRQKRRQYKAEESGSARVVTNPVQAGDRSDAGAPSAAAPVAPLDSQRVLSLLNKQLEDLQRMSHATAELKRAWHVQMHAHAQAQAQVQAAQNRANANITIENAGSSASKHSL